VVGHKEFAGEVEQCGALQIPSKNRRAMRAVSCSNMISSARCSSSIDGPTQAWSVIFDIYVKRFTK